MASNQYNPLQKVAPTSINLSNLGEILSKSILSAINTILLIGGFVVLFSILISMLKNTGTLFILSELLSPILTLLRIPDNYISGIISGILELTNGVQAISLINSRQLSTTIIIASFLIGFGGISVLLQVLSITSKQNISIKPYIIRQIITSFLFSSVHWPNFTKRTIQFRFIANYKHNFISPIIPESLHGSKDYLTFMSNNGIIYIMMRLYVHTWRALHILSVRKIYYERRRRQKHSVKC